MNIILPDDSPGKQCTKCKEFFPATNQYFFQKTKSRLESRCKWCCGRQSPLAIEVPEGMKQCSSCRACFPATGDYFHHTKFRMDGLTTGCKWCRGRKIPLDLVPLPEGMKRCTKCGAIRPATSEYFSRHGQKRDGLNSCCKPCDKILPARPVQPPMPGSIKRCTKCKTMLPATTQYFARDPRAPDGLKWQCRDCRRARATAVYKAGGEQKKVYSKRYREEHREQYRAYASQRRSRKRAAPGELTPEQIKAKLKAQKYRCYYSACNHSKFEKKDGHYIYELEHTIPLSRTEEHPRHDPSFVVLSCLACNSQKRAKMPIEWPEGGCLF